MKESEPKAVLVVGASGGIAQALVRKLLEPDSNSKVIAISRSACPEVIARESGSRLLWHQSDYSDESMGRVTKELVSGSYTINRLFVCNGALHQGAIFPEKRLKDANRSNLADLYEVNAIIPILWLQHLLPLLSTSAENIVTVFSARVGSIEDNQSGGWYAYRASKAALNMMLKSVAIEYRRFSQRTKFLSFHPGTTDTELSKPFQDRLREGQLFQPDYVADRLLDVIEQLPDDPTLNFIDWAGKPIAW